MESSQCRRQKSAKTALSTEPQPHYSELTIESDATVEVVFIRLRRAQKDGILGSLGMIDTEHVLSRRAQADNVRYIGLRSSLSRQQCLPICAVAAC